MIFETVVILWILYALNAPLWVWIVACLASVDIYYTEHKINKLNSAFKSFLEISTDALDFVAAKLKEKENGKKTENDNNVKERGEGDA